MKVYRSAWRIAIGVAAVGGAVGLSSSAWAGITAPASGTVIATVLPTATGTGHAGNSIMVTATTGQTEVTGCTTNVATDGAWSCTFTRALSPGTWDITAEETDATGTASDSVVTGIIDVPPAPSTAPAPIEWAAPTQPTAPAPDPSPSAAPTPGESAPEDATERDDDATAEPSSSPEPLDSADPRPSTVPSMAASPSPTAVPYAFVAPSYSAGQADSAGFDDSAGQSASDDTDSPSVAAKALPMTGDRLLPYGLAGMGLLVLGFAATIALGRSARELQ